MLLLLVFMMILLKVLPLDLENVAKLLLLQVLWEKFDFHGGLILIFNFHWEKQKWMLILSTNCGLLTQPVDFYSIGLEFSNA